jgi:cytochrome c-type protein NapB
MKIISKVTLGLVTATLLFVGCNESAAPAKAEVVKPTISEESLGLRKSTLNDESVNPNGTAYTSGYTGSGYKIERAFQDAPPMIPHDVTGLIPITINDNQCLGCHMPAEAKAMGMGATPIPESHFTNFRPTHSYALEHKNTSSETLAHVSIKKEKKLVGARFSCTLCHAPQDTGVLAVPNNFEAVYTDKDGASKSTWSGTKLMEGIDTSKSDH